MHRGALLLAYFFFFINSYAQLAESRGQYPFVHYTPKDGLVNSRVRKAFQDSKGRMYFLTYGGLSVYDGVRFKNYTTQNGLTATLVNDILEIGNDSFLIATNNGWFMNLLVNGKMDTFKMASTLIPVINHFYRHENGKIYLSTDDGLFTLENRNLRKLNTSLSDNNTELRYIGNITGTGNHLVLETSELNKWQALYLYDIEKNTIRDSLPGFGYIVGKDERNRIWASVPDRLFFFDSLSFSKGKISLIAPTGAFRQAQNYSGPNIVLDKNCIWFVFRNKENKNTEIRRIEENGNVLKMSLPERALSSISRHMLIDKENTIWLCNDGEGVFKVVNSPLQVFEDPIGKSAREYVYHAYSSNNITWYSTHTSKLYRKFHDELQEFRCNLVPAPEIFYANGNKLMAKDARNVYEGEFTVQNRSIYFRRTISIPVHETWGKTIIVDPNNCIIGIQDGGLGVWKDHQQLFRVPIGNPDIIDEIIFDRNRLFWAIKRYTGIDVFSLHPGDRSGYLQPVYRFPKDQITGSPRCFLIDTSGLIWVGTRDDGVACYRQDGNKLTQLHQFYAGSGLTDNFIITLACDSMNNIIVGTQTGLDRILRRDKNSYQVENLSKSSNFFVKINQAWADSKHAYALSFSGFFLQLSATYSDTTGGSPSLLLEEMKLNAQTISAGITTFRHKENNISFLVAAPSFIDEKQVAYSYLLEGSGNKQWSDTAAANAVINLTNLSPGKYNLKVKAFFPSTSYSPADLSYSFEIAPPWWQTVLFRLIAATVIMGLLIVGVRYYYNRKLVAQRRVLEKQQAIEKERTRIATDMHDDLGAGLSRIKFLSQALGNKDTNDESIKTALEKITGYSDEMTEKMGEIVWALNEKNDTLADLVAYTRSYAVEYLANHNIQCEANTPMHLPATFIPGEMRRNIFLSVKECLHNIIKHANASKVCFSVELNGAIQIVIHDNGKGIDWDNRRPFSNGLQNIQKRMSEIKGKADFFNEKGTKVLLRVPLNL